MSWGLSLGLAAAAAAVMQLSPEARAIINHIEARYEEVDAKLVALPPATTTPEKLARLIEVDQAGRVEMMAQNENISRLPPEQRMAVWTAAANIINPRDQQNVRTLKTLIPPDGWFMKSRDGDQATRDAFLIVQHATDDAAFMTTVLARMEPLVRQGEVRGADYALLYDRVALQDGRAQRYGSQIGCKDGRPGVEQPVEDYEHIDDRRRAIGLTQPQAEYEAQFANVPC